MMNKIIHRILYSDYSVVLLFDIIAKILTAITTIFVIRILTVEGYSDYTIYLSLSALIFSVVGSGLSIAYVRFAAERKSRSLGTDMRLYTNSIRYIIVASCLLLFLIPLISSIYKISFVIAGLSILYGCFLSLNKMNQSFFQAETLYKKSGMIINIKNVTMCVLIVLAYLCFHHVGEVAVMSMILGSAVVAFLIGLYIIKNETHVVDIDISSNIFALLRESSWCIIYSFFVAMFDQSCVLIMSVCSNHQIIAEYGVASKYYALSLMFLTSLFTVLRVKVSDAVYVDSKEARRKFGIYWIKKVWWIAALICGFCAFAAIYVFPILNGANYYNSIRPFQILLIGVFISYTCAPLTALMLSDKKFKQLSISSFIAMLLGCSICYLLLPSMGANAAAIAVVCSNGLFNVVSAIYILSPNKIKAE